MDESLKFKAMEDVCILYRGRIVHAVAAFELVVDEIIGTYFCNGDGKKEKELFHTLLSTEKITLSAKVAIIGFIIKNNYKDFESKRPKLLQMIDYILEVRNKVAHRKLLHTPENVNKFDGQTIYLGSWSTKKNKLIMNEFELNLEMTDQIVIKSKICTLWLYELLELIKLKEVQ